MVGRSLRLTMRTPDGLLTSLMLPVMLMLLFVYLFGGAIQTGTEYVTYVVPGVLLLSAGFGASMTAVTVSNDMTGGIIDRFRSLDVAGAAVLAGHVAASVVRNLASTVLVFGVAFLIGFRPSAGPLDWLAAAAVLLLFIGAISWLSAAVGLLAWSPEAAGGFVPGELPALPQQRLRTGRDHADVAPRGRRQPAGHPGHRDPARPAPGPARRVLPGQGRGLVPGHPGRLGGRLRRPVPPPHGLTKNLQAADPPGPTRRCSAATWWRRSPSCDSAGRGTS
jgi:hypothetical protein